MDNIVSSLTFLKLCELFFLSFIICELHFCFGHENGEVLRDIFSWLKNN